MHFMHFEGAGVGEKDGFEMDRALETLKNEKNIE
jgi:hypothetical protein